MLLREAGFTLVEIIVSLVLIGFLTVFAGIGLSTFTRGYLFATENTHMSQQSQIALTRITRELLELTDVSAASSTRITLENLYGSRTIGLDAGCIKIAESGTALADGDILIDNIGGFQLSYFSGSQSWSQGMDIRLLSAIQIRLTVNRSDSGIGSVDFSTLVHPRNTNNLGGAPPTATPPTQADYCFISAARRTGPGRTVWLLPAFLAFGLLMRRRKNSRQAATDCTQEHGSIVVALIIGILVISALGVSMLPLTSTSIFQQVWTQGSTQAYFLAESGLRYAASLYLNASTDAQIDALDSLHNQEYTLQNNHGRFSLEIFPFFFQTPPGTDQIDTDRLETRIAGGISPDLTLSFGRLKIGNNFYNYSGTDIDGQTITFFLDEKVAYVQSGTDVLSVARSSNVLQTLNEGDHLALKTGTGAAFPQRNGTFSIDGHVYAYLENDPANDRLLDIRDPNAAAMGTLVVDPETDVVLQKFIKLHATGTYGQGPIATQRRLVYHVPLPFGSEERVVFEESFDDLAAWETPTAGGFDIQTIGGDSAVKVTATEVHGGSPKAALMAWKWSNTDLDLAAAHRLGADFMLSYDAQVKTGFTASPLPTQGFTPDYPVTYIGFGVNPGPLPKYFAAGLSFRLDNSQNSYGLSFLRGDNSIPHPYDNIDDGMVPLNGTPLIVLWQTANGGQNRRWIAYKELVSPDLYDNDVETGDAGWTAQGLWNRSERRSVSATHAWYYGQEISGNYDLGNVRTSGGLISPDIYLEPGWCYTLSYRSWHSTETQNPNSFDVKQVFVSTNGGSTWTKMDQLTGNFQDWHERRISLAAYSGQTVQIRFYFDTIDSLYNNYEGWYVDDIKIETQFPMAESTLAVRLRESAAAGFSNGGRVAITGGERVVGQSSGVQATVDGRPIIASGSWADGTAEGLLLLRNPTGSLQTGETLKITGSPATATVTEFRGRDNYIRAFYGRSSSCGSADSNPLDFESAANPRGTVQWPPDEIVQWTAENDYFHLVQWDAVNGGISSAALIASAEEPGVIIRSSESALLTPASGTFNQPELGLHTFGHGSLNVYFDDFAVQTDIVAVSRAAPLQE